MEPHGRQAVGRPPPPLRAWLNGRSENHARLRLSLCACRCLPFADVAPLTLQHNDLASLPVLTGATHLFALHLPGNPLVLSAGDIALLSMSRLRQLELPAAAVPPGNERMQRSQLCLKLVA